ncbi:TonB-dependent receptor [Rhabdobacter roseus]|uniref:Iron complex outermembrane receptor protein n=1 Tax=Rhabdobacter roseus TaxID=1655419 RepID=A0A840TWP6_9BACT|nr:TonB-dependent receptor [Rhabdobacter roseus]MBB5287355.1 iron complex outermembrane receptor protein [Rhabdobacter roseus]
MRLISTYLGVLSLLLLGYLPLRAQVVISGQIIDAEDGKPLPGATVRAGEIRGTTTDEAGRFSLRNLPEAVSELAVSYIGYEAVRLPLREVLGQSPLTIRLQRSIFAADEVVVSATRVTDRTGMAYTNVSAEAIGKQNLGQDLPVLLHFTPSLVSTSDAGAGVGYTGIRVRGTDATRINVTINGIPYNDPESQGVFFVNMPDFASSVSSIQIQRGVGTSTNGAGAFGATVNINTNEFQREAYAELNNSYGSFNTWKNTVKVGSGLLNDKFTVDARLSRVASDGFVDRARSDLKSFYLSGGYFGKKSFVRFNAFSGQEVTYQSWYGSPEARVRGDREGMLGYIERNGLNERDAQNLLNSDSRTYNYYLYDNQTDNYQQDQYQLITSHALSTRLTLNANAFYVRGRGYYEEYRDDNALANYRLPDVIMGGDTISRTDLIRRRWLDNHFYGTTFSLDYNSYRKLTANFGGGWNRYDGDHFGEIIWARYASTGQIRERYYENNGLKTDFNLYGKVYYQFTDKLNAFGDAQIRTVSHRIAGTDTYQSTLDFDAQFLFFNPKLGLNYQLSEGSSAYASFSVANREPNRSDFTESIPENRPRAERLHDLEAGFRTQTSRWAFSLNYYLMNYKDQLVLTGEVNDVGGSVRTNVPRSYRTGLELEAAFALNNRWRWNANATFSQNKILDFTEYIINYETGSYETNAYRKTDIAFSPGLIAASQLTYSPLANVELALLTKYVGKQYLDNTTAESRRLDAYLTNDLRFIWTLTPTWAKQIQLTALVNNIFNERYESNGYTYAYIYGSTVRENFYYPQAGTNFLLGLNVRF